MFKQNDYWHDWCRIQVDTAARRLGLSKDIDIGVCGDVKLAAEALFSLLQGSSPACLSTIEERISEATLAKQAWENGKDPLTFKYKLLNLNI